MQLKKDFYYCGVQDPQLRVFDIIMTTEFGTSYNAYILKGSSKIALIETCKPKFFEEFKSKVEEIVAFDKIDYLVINHTEPDHSGSISKVIELNPKIELVGTSTAMAFLKEIVERDFYKIVVKDGDQLSLGDKDLEFMVLPNLHWPDTMYTYCPQVEVLFSTDSFGSHYSSEEVLTSKIMNKADYWKATKYYYDCIMGPFKPFVLKALQRIKHLPIQMIATGHGPVLDDGIQEVLTKYHEWSTVVNPYTRPTVVMPYVSAYGYTEQLGLKISEGIKAAGDMDVKMYDMVTVPAEEVLEAIGYAKGLLFGTPTIVGEALKPIWDLTTSMHANVHGGKLASAFGSYGWSGEGVPNILTRLKQLRMKVIDGFTVRFKPSNNELVAAYEYGYNFGCQLLDKPVKKANSTIKLKCLVCGEILEPGTEICPVCGVDKENFVELEVAVGDIQSRSDLKLVIIGGGVAAYTAAQTARSMDVTCAISIYSNEAYLPYNRPMLTKSLLALSDVSKIQIKPLEWYQNQNITINLNTEIMQINPDQHTITTIDGQVVPYDKLIVAAGAQGGVPPIEGSKQPFVKVIRSLDDVKTIQSMMKDIKAVTVIGGGVLGLEAAWEFKKAGLQVNILEVAPRVMSRQLDDITADRLVEVVRNLGCRVELGAKIVKISEDGSVVLANGDVFNSQLVVISAGVSANIKLAQTAGIETGRAVKVNTNCQTNIPDIYACGDCAEYEGVNYALWPEAIAMAKVAATSALGKEATYENFVPSLTFHGMNTKLFAIGDVGKDEAKQYKLIEVTDTTKGEYERYYFFNNRLCGAILFGNTSKLANLTKLFENKVTFDQFSIHCR